MFPKLSSASLSPRPMDPTIVQVAVRRLRPYDIDEVLGSICWQMDNTADLVNLACASRRFTDACMRVLWASPVFDGSPLVGMAHLFPPDLSQRLREGAASPSTSSDRRRADLSCQQDRNLRLPPKAFERFDYYARFVRALHLWHHNSESVIAWVLTQSRPGTWLFPGLVDLHLGASGDVLKTVPLYFTPTLRIVRLNHWDNHGLWELEPTEELRQSLLSVCALPALEKLDLADTLYTGVEHDPQLIEGFKKLAHWLYDLRAQSFLTLPAVFAELARNTRLHTVYLNLTDGKTYHEQLHNIISSLRDHFAALRTLGLVCTAENAVRVMQETHRAWWSVDLQIDSAVETGQLHEITTSLFARSRDLRSFALASPTHLLEFSDVSPALRLSTALQPLQALHRLRSFELDITFGAGQMLGDQELVRFFRCWPDLRSFVVRCDSDHEDGALVADEEADAAVTLLSLAAAARYCRKLESLTLPFVSTSLPDRADIPGPPATHEFELHLLRSHVHNHTALGAFVRCLWRNAQVTCAGCIHYGRTTFRV
ncbi:hypothetical protein CALVIDRAFT_538541 [Calocera viscosa TUFC12733]|uniref:Uncharacterized protein n=1 Tax=Calocera viscosa (strain TUFC12733) TaxID=1330018 RepID=A0A167KW61_CALVF|nr:hypothetical protein CALVIDRAFT_538541 [Calocera viscosa TUFC12733]